MLYKYDTSSPKNPMKVNKIFAQLHNQPMLTRHIKT